MTDESDDDQYVIKPIAKALRLLDTIGAAARPLTLAEASVQSGLPKSTAFKYIRTLLRAGYLSHDPIDDRYGIGPQIERLAESADRTAALRRSARPFMEELRERFNETVNLGILDGNDVVYLEMIHSTHRLRLHAVPGGHYAAYATGLGKALLAFLPEGQWTSHVPATLTAVTPTTITDRDALGAELAAIRRRGHALDRGESDEYVSCVAAPVLDANGRAIAAISVSGLNQRVEPQFDAIAAAVVTTAASIASAHTAATATTEGA